MKKLFLILSLVFLLLGCKKEEPEPDLPQTLSEFLIGEWTCTRQMVQGHQADLTLTFTENNYTLYVNFGFAGPAPFTSSNKHYIVYEEINRIRMDYPYTPDSYLVEYNIAWTDLNQINMDWEPRPTNEKNLTSNFTMLNWKRK